MGILTKVFSEKPSNNTYYISRVMFMRILMIGIASGLVTWLATMLLDNVVLTPIFCGSDSLNVSVCANSAKLSGYISAILIGIMTVPLLAVAGLKRPLLVVIAVVATLWGVPIWGGGVWWTSMIFSIVVYAFVYATIVWLNRLRNTFFAILSLVIFIVLSRIILAI